MELGGTMHKKFVTINHAQGKTETLCIINALRLARIEHCSGTVVIRFLPSETINHKYRKVVYKSRG